MKGQIMSQSNMVEASKINTTVAVSATQVASLKNETNVAAVTKDAGRVHVGGSMMRF